jgi:hypothetical protein
LINITVSIVFVKVDDISFKRDHLQETRIFYYIGKKKIDD